MTLRSILPRRNLLVAILAAAGGLLATPLAARADVFDPTCNGRISLGENRLDGQVNYWLACSDAIGGYSLVTLNRQVAGFDTEAVTLDFQTGEAAPGQDWSCSGPIPSVGIGCAGKATAGNKVTGSINLLDDPCVGKRPEVAFVVADATGRVAGPFRMVNAKPGHASRPLEGCPATATKKPSQKRSSTKKTST
jgi:hypothetical protein